MLHLLTMNEKITKNGRFDNKIESIVGIQPVRDKQGHKKNVYDLEFPML